MRYIPLFSVFPPFSRSFCSPRGWPGFASKRMSSSPSSRRSTPLPSPHKPELKPLEREAVTRILGSNPYVRVSLPRGGSPPSLEGGGGHDSLVAVLDRNGVALEVRPVEAGKTYKPTCAYTSFIALKGTFPRPWLKEGTQLYELRLGSCYPLTPGP